MELRDQDIRRFDHRAFGTSDPGELEHNPDLTLMVDAPPDLPFNG
jgi:hypothetical protein